MKKTIFIIIFGVLIIAALSLVPRKKSDSQNHPLEAGVVDFISCANAGFPVTESFPAQCKTSSGKVFVEDMSDYGEVVIDSPASGDLITSPVEIKGKAKGFWFFEATMPVVLKDENGNVLAQGQLRAQDDWMTENFVNFEGSLTFNPPNTDYGVIVISKDNPSGLPENDASYAVPVRFK